MGIPVIPDRRRVPRLPIDDSDSTERMSSGNAEADHILGGGFPANSINIIMGHPGSGKTIFAEQLIFHNAGEAGASTFLRKPLVESVFVAAVQELVAAQPTGAMEKQWEPR